MPRQRKIQTPEEFEQRTTEYFEWARAQGRPTTLTGLALYLGFTDKQFMIQYSRLPEFKEVAQWARLMVENGYEERLHSKTATGSIFALKNFGWKDTQDHHISGPEGGPIAFAGPRKMELDDWNNRVQKELDAPEKALEDQSQNNTHSEESEEVNDMEYATTGYVSTEEDSEVIDAKYSDTNGPTDWDDDDEYDDEYDDDDDDEYDDDDEDDDLEDDEQ